MRTADVAVVGGGIVGLAFARAYAKQGRKVVLFERNDFAVGASVRNFGLVWVIGQPLGIIHDRAMRSREIWLELLGKAGLWHATGGSLHLAYEEDEWTVLQEYIEGGGAEYGRQLLSPAQVRAKSDAVKLEGLRGALFSPTEVNLDPRQAIRALPDLLRKVYGVEVQLGVHVASVDPPEVRTTTGIWEVGEVVICSGADFGTLFPDAYASSGLTRCKLQMMRTGPQPGGWELGPTLSAGLTLAHYESFQSCPSIGRLKERLARQFPFYVQNGIHVLVSQTAQNELSIGDSHQYGLTVDPFDHEEINAAILQYLSRFATFPNLEIRERWHGVYAKLPGATEYIAQLAEGVRVVTGLGGGGMTLAFGLAEEIVGRA